MNVLHTAVFTDSQTLAGGLEFLLAHVVALAGFQALGGSLVRGSHRAMAFGVGLGLFVAVGLGVCQGADEQHGRQGECSEELFHGEPFRYVDGWVDGFENCG